MLPAPVLFIAQLMIALAMVLTFIRIVRGPSIVDRISALDLFAALIMVQCVILVLKSGFVSFLDVSTAIAVIAFLATVAFSKYLENKSS